MKKLYALVLGLLMSISVGFGQTTLAAGDIAILYFNLNNTPTVDRFAFVLLKDISASTVINFTDNGFSSNNPNNTGRTGEGFITFTSSASRVKGTVITYTGNTGEFTGSGSFDLSTSGDQLFAFQGSTANWGTQNNITLLYGINVSTTNFITTGTASSNASYLPTTLTLGSTAVRIGANNGYFANGNSSASTVNVSYETSNSSLLALISTSTNWYSSGTAIADPPSYTGALPVTYLNFGAKYTNNQVAVSWETATEQDNAYFDVERSADAENFTAIGRQTGKGLSDTRQAYSFIDESPLPGWNYYRLKQVDTGGTFALSRPVAVLNEGSLAGTALKLWPNPASGEVSVQLDGNAPISALRVSNMNGQWLSVPNTGNTINTSNLASGLYIIEAQTQDGRSLRQRFVKE